MKLVASVALLISSCQPRGSQPATTTAAAAPRARPHPRPSKADPVEPIAYEVELEIDPGRDEFSGRVLIDLDVHRPVRDVRLDAVGLDIDAVVLVQGGLRVPATAGLDSAREELIVRAPRALPIGPARLEIAYRGRYGTDVGAFRPPGRANLVFTQFEPIEARRAIPCFDQPRFKVPWRIRLVVPSGMQAFSNAPAESEEQLASGATRVSFAVTRPLPSYLVAFAAGDLRVTELASTPVPMRLIEAGVGLEQDRDGARAAPDILRRLEQRLGATPYPKVDIVAVPGARFPGMENAGLITIEAGAIHDYVLAHELSHLWFGDLVTPASWRDLWLAEGLTSWMTEGFILTRFGSSPSLARTWQVATDSLPDAGAALLAPIEARNPRRLWDWEQNPSSITLPVWGRPGVILAMLDRWIGGEALLGGVRSYLEHHAHSVATTADVAWHVAEASRPEAFDVLTSFLAERGLPELAFELDCTRRRPRLRIAQRRYRSLGSAATRADGAARWTIPVCVRHPRGVDCAVLSRARGSLALSGPGCPAWFHPNAHAAGYYRSRLSNEDLERLLAVSRQPDALTGDETAELALIIDAMVQSGALEVDRALNRLSRLVSDSRIEVFAAVVQAIRGIRAFAPPDLEPAFSALLRTNFVNRTFDLEEWMKSPLAPGCAPQRPRVCRALARRHGKRLRAYLARFATPPRAREAARGNPTRRLAPAPEAR